jgi:Trp operon repressor
MEGARIVQLHPAPPAPAVRVDGERVILDQVVLSDPALARFIAQRPPDARVELVERALRIGLMAIQDAGTTIDVELVRREFEALLQRADTLNERAALALDGVLRTNFADGDGRLPRTLERFLGDRGQLRTFVTELFDENRRDSAIGRMRELLGRYFDGDASRLAQLLDPTRLGSPLHQFRTEVSENFGRLNERLSAIEAAAIARTAERSRSAAKGTDFEDAVGASLADICRGSDDLLERTADEAGAVIRSKKGDYLITLDERVTRGADVRIVVECKDRPVSARLMREELAAARQNRSAAAALVCFTAEHAPAAVAPFLLHGSDVYCVLDRAAPEPEILEAAVRLARLVALVSLERVESEVDTAAASTALEQIRGQLDAIRALKSQLTSIGTASQQVSTGLDRLRDGILARLADAEAALRPAK